MYTVVAKTCRERFSPFLYTFLSLASNPLPPRLFYTHKTLQNGFVFSLPYCPSASRFFKSNFPASYWSDSSHLCTNTTTCSRSILVKVFGPGNFICGELLAIKKNDFLDFLEVKLYIFHSSSYRKLRYANVIAVFKGS